MSLYSNGIQILNTSSICSLEPTYTGKWVFSGTHSAIREKDCLTPVEYKWRGKKDEFLDLTLEGQAYLFTHG